MSDNDTGSMLAALFAGAALGAVAGVLFAPKAGEETRRQIKDTGEEWIGKVAKAAEDAAGKVKEAAAQVRDGARAERDAVQSAFEAGKEAWNEAKKVSA